MCKRGCLETRVFRRLLFLERRMKFDRTFQVLSYAAVFCGFASLWISGTFGLGGVLLFGAVFAVGIILEKTGWQMSEAVGTVLTVLAIPFYYFLWQTGFFYFSNSDEILPGILARLILTLTGIKLLQRKGDRDWIFLYVMAFFQVLLAAGLSISPLYFASFVAFVLIMAAAIILFEIKRTRAFVAEQAKKNSGPLAEEENAISVPKRRLPMTAITLVALIVVIATPLFFLLPRVGGAGVGGGLGGVSTFSGFSDSVRLGGIGSIQQNTQIVMRVRVENRDKVAGRLKWRGIALDTFDNRTWTRTRPTIRSPRTKGERDLIQVDYATGRDSLIVQTVYLEPLDTQVLFSLARPVAVQANFPTLFVDSLGSITFPRSGERSTYKVLSDVELPPPGDLQRDRFPYPADLDNYLQIPKDLDPRIAERAAQVTETATNRFDAAELIEYHLRNDFGYTLEQKAGGDQPLADFLFNVREGHCEYFATAMAIMLRTQGIATRVVNGFQEGEYNETADVYVVRQREAHSWVEVYFPGEDVWVPFDPTPAGGQNPGGESAGIYAKMNKYLEALEMIWIQYFVAFDNQEQRTLFTSIRQGVSDYNSKTTNLLGDAQSFLSAWWAEVRGDSGTLASITALGWAVAAVALVLAAVFLFVMLYRKAVKWKVWTSLWEMFFARRSRSIVEFYERMQRVLASKGFVRENHQTPLEFAHAVGMSEVVNITEKYNRVRFGEKHLSRDESAEIESWLEEISTTETQRHREKKD
jgi:transglutaminase-like putative cysteine protease